MGLSTTNSTTLPHNRSTISSNTQYGFKSADQCAGTVQKTSFKTKKTEKRLCKNIEKNKRGVEGCEREPEAPDDPQLLVTLINARRFAFVCMWAKCLMGVAATAAVLVNILGELIGNIFLYISIYKRLRHEPSLPPSLIPTAGRRHPHKIFTSEHSRHLLMPILIQIFTTVVHIPR